MLWNLNYYQTETETEIPGSIHNYEGGNDHYLPASKIRNVDLAKQELGVNLREKLGPA